MTGLLGLSIIVWLVCFLLDAGSDVRYGVRGGGKKSEPAPPPSPPPPQPVAERSAEAISAQIAAVPRILETQQRYGPEFTQLQLESLQRFGPQFAEEAIGLEEEFGPRLAAATLAEQRILDPSRVAGSEAIAEYLGAGFQGLTDEELRIIEENTRAAGAARGLAESGFGAISEVAAKFGARQALQNRFLNVGLAAAGRLPAAGAGTVGASPFAAGGGQLVQNVSPSSVLGAQATKLGYTAGIYGTQAGIYGQQLAAQPPGIGGQIVGGLAGGLTGGFGQAAGMGLAGRMFPRLFG